MSNLVVMAFDNEYGAEQVRDKLVDLQKAQLIKSDYGIDDTFIKEVGNSIQPGTSAIFVLVREATPDKVIEQLKPYHGKIIHTSLSAENEAQLKAAFAAE